jgi:hypothetical protein
MPSPLAEADATSLQEAFDKDPLKLTDPDKDLVVAALRAQRERWEVAERKVKAKAAPAPPNLSASDLGL